MASPPNRAHARSPVYPPHIPLPNPKKRPSLSVASHSAPKRRKPSSVTTSTPATSHPLRQTSFPPEESAGDPNARSPSIESDVTGVTGGRSVITAGIGARKARARKRRKGEGSVRSGARASGGDEASGSGQVEDGAEEEEEDGDGDGDEGLVDDGEKVDRAAEKKNLAILVDAFNDDQNDRYNMFRRIKLKKETVRKIANQTLSQSVPPSVITTINGYTKVFIGTLIERARDIQQQYASPPSSPPLHSSTQSTLPLSSTQNTTNSLNDPFLSNTTNTQLSSNLIQKKPQRDLGPLLPDHFREALRRYRRDGEGGGTGLGGLSLGLGVQGTKGVRLGGKRLFN